MNEFKEAQANRIFIGGYKCPCCNPILCKNKAKEKQRLHKLARFKLKQKTRELLESEGK